MGGQTWKVRRRWAPRGPASLVASLLRRRKANRERFKRKKSAEDQPLDRFGCLAVFDLLDPVALVIVGALLVVIVLVLIAPVILAIVDVVVLLVLAVAGAIGRFVFRRPWTIEAVGTDGVTYCWQAVGWRASAERRDEIASYLQAGIVPGPDGTP